MSYHHDTLSNEHTLPEDFSLVSKNGKYHVKPQSDGNLVLYKDTKPLWASDTYKVGSGSYHLKTQGDGNLCLYDGTGKCTWSSNTYGKGTGPYKALMQDDGNFVLYDRNGTPIWASNTYQG
jgi:hypothetical protein